MDVDHDLARIAEQERRLRFPRFDAGTAWALGSRLKAAAEARGAAVTIEIRLAGQILFFYAMEGTAPVHAASAVAWATSSASGPVASRRRQSRSRLLTVVVGVHAIMVRESLNRIDTTVV